MNRKKLIVLAVVAFCILMVARVSAHPTKLYFTFDPESIQKDGEYPQGEEFTATLRVDAVADMYLWVVTIEWDPALLELVGTPVEGGCLKSFGNDTTCMMGDIGPGIIPEWTCTRKGIVPGASVPPCPDDLGNITFRVIGEPCNYPEISITFSDLLDSTGASIDRTIEPPGPFHIIPEVASVALGLGAMLAALGAFAYKRRKG